LPRRATVDWSRKISGEPALSELLTDPCLHLLLRRDGLSLTDLRQVIAHAQYQLSQRRRGVCRLAA